MSLIQSGISLKIQNADDFLKDGKKVDELLIKMAASAGKAVSSLNGLGTALNKIKDINLGKASGGINRLANSFENLAEKTKGTAIANLSKKIDRFSESINKIPKNTVDNISRISNAMSMLSKLPSKGLESLATNLNTLSKSIRTIRESTGGKNIFTPLTSGISKLANVIGEVDTKKLSGVFNAIDKISSIVETISPSALDSVSESLKKFSAALRSFTTGKNIDALPKQLKEITKHIPVLVRFVNDLASSGDDLEKFEQATETLATSLHLLASSVRSLANLKLQKLQTNINSIIIAFNKFRTLLDGLDLTATRSDFSDLAATLTEFGKTVSNFARREKSIDKFSASLDKVFNVLRNIDTSELEGLINTLERLSPTLKQLGEVTATFNRSYGRLTSKIRENNKEQSSSISVFKSLGTALNGVKVSVNVLFSGFKLLIPAISNVITLTKNLSLTLLKLPIKVVTTSLNALKKVFIDLPISIVSKSFKVLITIVQKFFSTINSAIKGLLSIERNIKRVQKALSILLAPFRALISLVTSLISVLGRLAGVFNVFNRSTKGAKSNIEQYNDSLKQTNDTATRTNKEIVVINRNIEGTSTRARIATTAFAAFGAALGARGISTAIKRLVSLQLTMKSLSLLSNVVTNGFRNITNVLGNMTRTAFDAASRFEGIRLSINSAFAREGLESGGFDDLTAAMEGTQKTADELLGRIRTLAIASPFGREALADVFLAARNFGFASNDAEILTRMMSDLGAQANLNAADMREVTRALGQIGSEGKASLENLNQIGDRSIPIFNQLAKNLGVTRAELRKMISAGEVSSQTTIEAFLQIGKQAEGQAALATTSLKGLLATFQDFKSDALRNLFQPVFDELKPLASNLLTETNIDVAIASFTKLGQSIAAVVVPAIKSFVTFVGSLQDIIAGIPQPVLDAITTFGTFAATVATVSLVMGALQATIGLTVGILFTFLNPISLAVGLFVALATQSEGLRTALTQLGQSFFNLITGASTVQAELTNLQTMLMQIPNPLTLVSNALTTLRNDFITVFGGIATTVQTSVSNIVTFFGSTLTSVAEWGSNIVIAFADGILATVGVVANALSAIGDMLAFWLSPGSPPRIAPNIDTWGQLAAEEFLGGFDNADFRAVSDFGSTVQDLLSSLNIEGVNTAGLVENFSTLIAEINDTGTFSQEAFGNLIAGAGGAKAEIAALASDFLTLQVEQEKLNKLTMDYDAALSNVDSQLMSIESREAFEKEQKSIDELNRRLQNTNLSVQQRTAIERELQKITVQRSKRELSEQKKAAQDRISQAQSDIDSTKERIKLSEQFGDANAQAGIAGATGSAATGQLKTPKAPKIKKLKASDILPDIGGSLSEAFAKFKAPKLDAAGFKTPLDQIQASLGTTQTKLSETTQRVKDSFAKIQTNIKTTIDNVKKQFSDWGFTIERVRVALVILGGVIASPLVIGAISSLTPALIALASPLGIVSAGVTGLAVAFGILVFQSGGVVGAIDTLSGAFDRFQSAVTLGANIEGGTVLDSLTAIDITSLDSIATGVGLALGNIVEEITNFSIGEFNLGERLSGVFTFDVEGMRETATTLVGDISSFFTDNVFTPISNLFTGSSISTFSLGGMLSGLFTFDESAAITESEGVVASITTFFKDKIVDPISTAFTENDSILGSIKDSYISVYTGLFQAAGEAITGIDLTSVSETLSSKLNETGIGQVIEREFAGLFGVDLSDSITSAATSLETITGSLESLGQFFTDTGTTISDGIQAIIDGFNAFIAIPFVNEFITNLGDAFSELFQDVSNPEFISALTELATTLGVLMAGAVATTAVLLQVTLVPILRNLGDVVQTAVTFINDLVAAFLLVATGVTQLIQGDISGFATILDGIGTAGLAAVTAIANLGADLAQFVLDFTINIAELIGFDQEALQTKADALFDRIREFWTVDNLKDVIGELSFEDILPDWLTSFSVETITALLPEAWTNFTFADLLPDGLTSGFSVPGLANFNLTGIIPLLLQNFTLDDATSLLSEAWTNFSFMDLIPEGLKETEIPGADGVTIGAIFDKIVEGANNARAALTEAFNDPTAAIATGAGTASDFFQSISDRYDSLAEKLEELLPNPVGEALSSAVSGIADGFELISELFETVSDLFNGEFGDPFEVTIKSINVITEFVSNIGTTIGELTSAFDGIKFPEIPNPFSGILDSAKGLTDTLGLTDSEAEVEVTPALTVNDSKLTENAQNIANTVVNAFDDQLVANAIDVRGFSDNVERAIESVNSEQLTLLAEGVGISVTDGVVQGLNSGEITPEVSTFVQDLVTALKSEAQIESPSDLTFDEVGIPLGEGILGGIVEALSLGSEQILTALQSVISSLNESMSTGGFSFILDANEQITQFEMLNLGAVQNINDMVDNVLDEVETLNEDSTEFVEEMVTMMTDSLQELIEFMTENFKDAIEEVIKDLRDLKNFGTAAIKDFVSASRRALLELVDIFREVGDDAVEGLLSKLRTLSSRAVTVLNQAVSAIRSTFGSGLGSTWGRLGFQFGNDLEAGIVEGVGTIDITLGNALINEIKKALERARSATGTRSPSELFKKMLGMPLGEGVTGGAVEVVKTLGDNIAKNLGDTVKSTAKTLDKGFKRVDRQFKKLDRSFGRGIPNPISPDINNDIDETSEFLDTLSSSFDSVVRTIDVDLQTPFDELDVIVETIDMSFQSILDNIDTLIPRVDALSAALASVKNPSTGKPIEVGPITPASVSASSLEDEGEEGDVIEPRIVVRPRFEIDEEIIAAEAQGLAVAISQNLEVQVASTATEFDTSFGALLTSANSNEVLTSAKDIGEPISKSLVSGISSGLENAELSTDLTSLIGGLKTSANISTLSEDEIGVPIGNGIIAGIESVLDTAVTALTTTINNLLTSLESSFGTEGLFSNVLDVEEEIAKFTTLNENVVAQVQTMVNDVVESLDELNQQGFEQIEELVNDAIDQFTIFIEFMLNNVIDALNELLAELEAMAQKGAIALRNFVDRAKAELIKLIEVFVDVGVQSVDGLINSLTVLADRAVSVINNQVREIAAAFEANSANPSSSPFFLLGDTLGKQLADGIIVGVEGSAFGITNAIVGEIKKAIREAQERLGIASPSTFSKVELGVPVGQGVEGGIISTGPQMGLSLINAITSAIQAAREPALKGLSTLQTSLPSQTIQGLRNQPTTSSLSTTQVSNMNTSSVTNSAATTNNYNMTIQEATPSTASNAKRNFRRMRMRKIRI